MNRQKDLRMLSKIVFCLMGTNEKRKQNDRNSFCNSKRRKGKAIEKIEKQINSVQAKEECILFLF